MKSIVAATDGSESAERAVGLAAALAKAGDADLWTVHVPGAEPKISAKELEDYARSEHMSPDEALATASEAALSQANNLALGHGVKSIRTDMPSGDPAEAIMKCARDRHADLIVVGRRGRGRLAGLLLGSVSQKLVTLAPCSVLVVP
jgi:nucleotide-binding universal stress UspA family protein